MMAKTAKTRTATVPRRKTFFVKPDALFALSPFGEKPATQAEKAKSQNSQNNMMTAIPENNVATNTENDTKNATTNTTAIATANSTTNTTPNLNSGNLVTSGNLGNGNLVSGDSNSVEDRSSQDRLIPNGKKTAKKRVSPVGAMVKLDPRRYSVYLKDDKKNLVQESFTSASVRWVLWFYRILGLTFGGLTIRRSTNTSTVDAKLKYCGLASLAIPLVIATLSIVEAIQILAPIMKYNNTVFYLLLTFHIAFVAEAVVVAVFVQSLGACLHQFLLKYPITKATKRVLLSILIAQLALSTLTTVVILAVSKRQIQLSFLYVIFTILNCFYLQLVSWALATLLWLITIVAHHFLVDVRQALSNGSLRSATAISVARKKLIQTRNQLNCIDSKFAFVQMFTMAVALYAIFVNIYTIGYYFGTDDLARTRNLGKNKLRELMESKANAVSAIPYFFIAAIPIVIKLLANCYLNQMTHVGAKRTFAVLDDIELQTSHEDVQREALFFTTINRSQLPFGFTIGGFVSYGSNVLFVIFALVAFYSVIIFSQTSFF